jgi:hypothetical protein
MVICDQNTHGHASESQQIYSKIWESSIDSLGWRTPVSASTTCS